MAVHRKSNRHRYDLCEAGLCKNEHLGFRKSNDLRLQFLLRFPPDHEFLHCGSHYFFNGPAILIRDLSQQSHRPL
jgi:hypothetical protein